MGAFNVPNLEALTAVVEAAEELNAPVIIAHVEIHENMFRLKSLDRS